VAFTAQCLSLPSFVSFHSVSFAGQFVGHVFVTTAESPVPSPQSSVPSPQSPFTSCWGLLHIVSTCTAQYDLLWRNNTCITLFGNCRNDATWKN